MLERNAGARWGAVGQMLQLALVLAVAAPSALALVDSATSARGCPTRLVGDSAHPFHEAQLACDAYLSFAIVDELLAGAERAPRVDALARLLDDALGRGQKPFRSLPSSALAGVSVSSSVLSRGWLLAMMAGAARVDALPAERLALFDAVAAGLAEDLTHAEREGVWLPSFRGGYWPCDHALAASGLALHGALRSRSSTAAGSALAARLARTLAAPSGFVTQVNARGGVVEATPRGTTLAWTAAFLALGGHDEARAFARVLDEDFCEALPFDAHACREWPRGNDRAADAVSGPLFMGYGSGASALAIAAFRATGDEDTARGLAALSTLAPTLARVPDVRATPARYPLENAILRWGEGARPWLPLPSPRRAPTLAP